MTVMFKAILDSMIAECVRKHGQPPTCIIVSNDIMRRHRIPWAKYDGIVLLPTGSPKNYVYLVEPEKPVLPNPVLS